LFDAFSSREPETTSLENALVTKTPHAWHAPHPEMTLIERGTLRQGAIAFIHSAPTGESVLQGERAA
jgi:hypothetical protein